jgi:hypothetical protein
MPFGVLLIVMAVNSLALETAQFDTHPQGNVDVWDAPHLVFTQVAEATTPVWITAAGDGSGRLFFVEEDGVVKIVGNQTPFLELGSDAILPLPNISLVSLAFPPKFSKKGYFYLSYSDTNNMLTVSRFYLSPNPDQADPNSEQIIGKYVVGCHGGQIVFAPDGTLYLNFAGPIANVQLAGESHNLDALSGKMVAILNESGPTPVNSGLQDYWPFSKYFDATDCSVIGGAFDKSCEYRMKGIYFYGDEKGTIWGLKHVAQDWVQINLASPTFLFDPEIYSIRLPGTPIINNTNIDPITITITQRPPVINITNPTTITISPYSGFFGADVVADDLMASRRLLSGPSPKNESSITTNLMPISSSGQQSYPFQITAFGQDENGRVYVANYGAPYNVAITEGYNPSLFVGGGGIYRIDDDPLQCSVETIRHGRWITLQWLSMLGINYEVQSSSDASHWYTLRRYQGTGRQISDSNLPNSSRLQFRVICKYTTQRL